MKKIWLIAAALIFVMSHAVIAAEDERGHEGEHEGGHEEETGGHEDEAGTIELTKASMDMAGIVVAPLVQQTLQSAVKAPGEVKLNAYLSSQVAPRITAQVIERHARLGDEVESGQPLVTLSSVALAAAMSDLLVAYKEWKRVEKLGSSVVSIKRFSTARIAYQQARAQALAYGMSESQLEQDLDLGAAQNPGTFILQAPQGGTIVSDAFIVGELVEPGRVLFNIVNENLLWVESRLSPELARDIAIGEGAQIRIPDLGWRSARVIQKFHTLDEETRTIGVRMEVGNEGDRLHPGMYVETRIDSAKLQAVLAVPSSSVLRSADGDWVVFVEGGPAHFKSEEIKIVRIVDDMTVIDGLPEGTRLVVAGAFFVQSELAKSGFSVHNH